jgi:TM2 domain-containing membrane protein YozV/Tfp pilus assembly protein PilE
MIQQSLDENTLDQHRRIKGLDEKFCESCGEIIKIRAEICPKCGVRLRKQVSKAALLLLTFFLGAIGIHKFYLGKYWQGILYVLFFWTGIPGLIALIEFVIYAFTSSERLQEKYSASGSTAAVAVAVVFGLIFVIGILAAIAIPNFAAYRTRAYNAAAQADLRNAATAQEAYLQEHKKYAGSIEALMGEVYGLYISKGVNLNMQSLDGKNYMIVSFHESGNKKYVLSGPNGTVQESPKQ